MPAHPAGAQVYLVKATDTPASVAARFGLSVRALLSQVGAPIRPGEELVLTPPWLQQATAPTGKYLEVYRVRAGDTLAGIAGRLGLTVEELADFNQLTPRLHLTMGETLGGVAARYAESLRAISQATRLPPEQLLRQWNSLTDEAAVPEGRLVVVGWDEPAAGDLLAYPLYGQMAEEVTRQLRAEQGSPAKGPLAFWNHELTLEVYTVRAGDTLEGIARRFGARVDVVLSANGLSPLDTLREGQPLFVPPLGTDALGAVYFYVCIPTEDTCLRARPEASAPGIAIGQGEVLFAYGNETNGWYAVPLQSEDPKKQWGWVNATQVTLDRARPYFAPGVPAPADTAQEAPAPAPAVEDALKIAYTYRGTPYRLGGTSHNGIDCSALVRNVFVRARIWPPSPPPPRVACEQMKLGTPVALAELQPGDRLYFDLVRQSRRGRGAAGVADHTGIYVGGGYFIHASPPAVTVTRLAGKYLANFVGARRSV